MLDYQFTCLPHCCGSSLDCLVKSTYTNPKTRAVVVVFSQSAKGLARVSMGNDKKEITECSFLHHSSSLHQRRVARGEFARGEGKHVRGNMPQQFLNHLKRARPISFRIHGPPPDLPAMGRNWFGGADMLQNVVQDKL